MGKASAGPVALGLLCALISASDAAMVLTSPSFKDYGTIPSEFGCDFVSRSGFASSPPLEWARPPAKTQSFILLVDDVDDDSVNWVVKDIPRDTSRFELDVSLGSLPGDATELSNSLFEVGYTALCPPPEQFHTFRFRLYARDVPKTRIDLPSAGSKANITGSGIDALLQDDGHTLYCAVLVGKIRVESYTPPPETRTVNYEAPEPGDSVAQVALRFPKPSETRKNPRRHYGPRPATGNVTALCTRQRLRGVSGKDYAQLCDAKRVDEQVEEGGVEQPAVEWNDNPLLSKGGVSPRYLDAHKQPDGRAWDLNDKGVPVPPRRRPIALSQQQATAVPEDASRGSSMAPALAPQEADGVELVQWQCGGKGDDALVLRSPLFDSCEDDVEVVGELPSEFACDRSDVEQFARRLGGELDGPDLVVSPALRWRSRVSGIGSFVIFLEHVATKRVHWLVTGIPPKLRSLPIAASGSMLEGVVELDNSFQTTRYVSPCFLGKLDGGTREDSPLYRFHMYARPEALTSLPPSARRSPAMLDALLMDASLASAHLDMRAPVP